MTAEELKYIRKKMGDTIEIPTAKGLAYGQYTHRHTSPPRFGCLIRILQGFYKTRPTPEELEYIVNQSHRFRIFFPLGAAINQNIFEIVDNFPIPESAHKFPIFKSTNAMPKSDPKEASWSLWDGEKSWQVGKITLEEQMEYPEKMICNDTSLIKSIETGMFFRRKLC